MGNNDVLTPSEVADLFKVDPEVSLGSLNYSREPYYAVIGLMGLVLVFCLYTALKHRELNDTRAMLMREAAETDDVRTRLSEILGLFQMSTTLNLQLRLWRHLLFLREAGRCHRWNL